MENPSLLLHLQPVPAQALSLPDHLFFAPHLAISKLFFRPLDCLSTFSTFRVSSHRSFLSSTCPCASFIPREMVLPKGEERAVQLAREAVELVDAGHREVRRSNFFSPTPGHKDVY